MQGGSIKANLTPALRSFKGQATKHTTVKMVNPRLCVTWL